MSDRSRTRNHIREKRVRAILANHRGRRQDLLEALHRVQSENKQNYLSESDLALVARELNVPLSRVYGVATFYSLFSLTPRGRHIIRVCENAPCHVVGAREIIDGLAARLGISVGGTTPDGRFTLETTSCLGVCGVAPVLMIDDRVYGNLSLDKLDNILGSYRQEE